MDYTQNFKETNKEFIYMYSDELAFITPTSIDIFMLITALQDYYYDTLGFVTGGPLHIVLDDYNLEDSHINSCLKACTQIEDVVGVNICQMLLAIPFIEREFMFEHQWFFNQYIREVKSNALADKLSAYYKTPTQSTEKVRIIKVRATLKPAQYENFTNRSEGAWMFTFKNERKEIATRDFEFHMTDDEKINDYLKLSEIESIKLS